MNEYTEEKAIELIKKILGLDKDRSISGLYRFGDCSYEPDETMDGNPAIYFQIPSIRKTYDFGGKYGIVEIKDYTTGYYDLINKKIVNFQVIPETEQIYDEIYFITIDVEWSVSKFRAFLGWYRVDINALNYLHKDKLMYKRLIKKRPMPSWVERELKERVWLHPYRNSKIPKKEMKEAHKELLDYFKEFGSPSGKSKGEL